MTKITLLDLLKCSALSLALAACSTPFTVGAVCNLCPSLEAGAGGEAGSLEVPEAGSKGIDSAPSGGSAGSPEILQGGSAGTVVGGTGGSLEMPMAGSGGMPQGGVSQGGSSGSHQGGSAGMPQGGSAGTIVSAGSGGAPQGGSGGMPTAGSGGSSGAPQVSYKDFDSCSCNSSGKLDCQNLYPMTTPVVEDLPPTCTCNQFSCQDLSYDVPQAFWLQIECTGTSTKGDVVVELWDTTSMGKPLACGGVYNLLRDGTYVVDVKEGSQQLSSKNVTSGAMAVNPTVLTFQLD